MMSNMSLIETSLHIALRAYAGKVDKAGRPLRVMAKMRTELEMPAVLPGTLAFQAVYPIIIFTGLPPRPPGGPYTISYGITRTRFPFTQT